MLCSFWRRWRGSFLGSVHSDRASNPLIYPGMEFGVLSKTALKTLRMRVDFDSTMRRFESSGPSQRVLLILRLTFCGGRISDHGGDLVVSLFGGSLKNSRLWKSSASICTAWPMRSRRNSIPLHPNSHHRSNDGHSD